MTNYPSRILEVYEGQIKLVSTQKIRARQKAEGLDLTSIRDDQRGKRTVKGREAGAQRLALPGGEAVHCDPADQDIVVDGRRRRDNGAGTPTRSSPEQKSRTCRFLRIGASSNADIIDRLDVGRKVELIEVQNSWSRVRDNLTLKEGWIASRFLKDREPETKPDEPPKQKPTSIPPALAPSVIIQRIIIESVARYPGSCACPYSTDRRGRRCGNRSAYSKPGGYAPICFAKDVTNSMIEAYR